MRELAELAAARGALEPRRVIRALGETFARWRAPRSPERERLAREHGVYSPEVVERGVQLALAGWTESALESLRAREVPSPCWVPPVTAVWLAGSIPTAAFSALALPLLAGSAVYAKPASADPLSARFFAASLAETDPAIGAALAVGSDAKALDEADAVVAHGSDATIAALRARVGAGRPFLGYGHKGSLAALGPAVEPAVAARRLALDVALWDGRGCLSPAWVLAVDAPRGRAAELARSLASALEEVEDELPRGALAPGEASELVELRARAAVREGTRLEMAAGASTWTVALEAGDVRPPPGAFRFVSVVPVPDLESLGSFCAGLTPTLSCVGHAGFGAERARLAELAAAAGASRLCPLGRMQLPPLDWNHDGQPPLRPLVRTLDQETAEG
ncbi:MAG TPA: acyl-CoA reductase [Myxococcota bacterium]|nr:acyl-CoA reductase [Myxococcota bacterium]